MIIVIVHLTLVIGDLFLRIILLVRHILSGSHWIKIRIYGIRFVGTGGLDLSIDGYNNSKCIDNDFNS